MERPGREKRSRAAVYRGVGLAFAAADPEELWDSTLRGMGLNPALILSSRGIQ